jgi:PIN domain nuclease of toxin-antitoxin system
VIVLDTHLWFWFINEEHERFPQPWKEAIEIVVIDRAERMSIHTEGKATSRQRRPHP